ncbi:3-ketoacyl-CoA synthase 15 [Durio zibethinus]|uniref:3-ketoacyl-CoA synthase n=1 Tax=Durio zibethinus TaxID=66656 RepID=A0A6P5ZLB0_DURZI|nr:3-ketoacyl-CoA synthase 15 [Durio zibethinus]
MEESNNSFRSTFYLLTHGFYVLIASLFILLFSFQFTCHDFIHKYNLIHALCILGLLGLILYIYFNFTRRSTYLLDFACSRPPNDFKISKEEFIKLARKSGNFNERAIKFQQRALYKSGIGDESYMPKLVFQPGHKISLRESQEEVAMLIFGAIGDLLAATKIKPKDIGILVTNSGVLNTTPSLSSMVINHYKLKHNIQSFNLGGMGCAAGIIAIDLARDLLHVYPTTYALVVSTEAISCTWYAGNNIGMLLSNCLFRMGAAAMLLSSRNRDRWRSKYELKQLIRSHKGMDHSCFKSIYLNTDSEDKQGISISKDVIEVGRHALKANIATLLPLVRPIFEQFHFFTNLPWRKKIKPYIIPNYKFSFEHICVIATSKKVLDEMQKHLGLTDEYMEAPRKTLERFGNTSSSSIWYELAFLEANTKIKKGDRVWQIAFGSGFKCNSVVWNALRNGGMPKQSPWIENSV